MRVSQLFNTLLFTQHEGEEEEQEVRVSQLFNTLLFTQQEEEEQEVRVSQLFNDADQQRETTKLLLTMMPWDDVFHGIVMREK